MFRVGVKVHPNWVYVSECTFFGTLIYISFTSSSIQLCMSVQELSEFWSRMFPRTKLSEGIFQNLKWNRGIFLELKKKHQEFQNTSFKNFPRLFEEFLKISYKKFQKLDKKFLLQLYFKILLWISQVFFQNFSSSFFLVISQDFLKKLLKNSINSFLRNFPERTSFKNIQRLSWRVSQISEHFLQDFSRLFFKYFLGNPLWFFSGNCSKISNWIL